MERGIFSRVRGELGLIVYITDDPSIKSSLPASVAGRRRKTAAIVKEEVVRKEEVFKGNSVKSQYLRANFSIKSQKKKELTCLIE